MKTEDENEKTYAAASVYDALCRLLGEHVKLYGTGGKYADYAKFDFDERSLYVGKTRIICLGKIHVSKLETCHAVVSLKGTDGTALPWMTPAEARLDPRELYARYAKSVPSSADKYVEGNFPALEIDDLTDDEMISGLPRGKARINLEAWIFCASMNGALKRFVESNGKLNSTYWYWEDSDRRGLGLVILTRWFDAGMPPTWTRKGNVIDCGDGSIELSVNERDARIVENAPALLHMLKRLSREAFALSVKTGRYALDTTIAEVNKLVKTVEEGK